MPGHPLPFWDARATKAAIPDLVARANNVGGPDFVAAALAPSVRQAR